MSQTRPITPASSAAQNIPDVDMSGLTEEEKAMIQSVMLRAQEADSSEPSPQPPPPVQPTKISGNSRYFEIHFIIIYHILLKLDV